MRGKEPSPARWLSQTRITPAYAGKRMQPAAPWTHRPDHPRICGEKPSTTWRSRPFWGSPPHMRGKVGKLDGSNATVRITPAYAGKSVVWPCRPLVAWDHPRICGEKRQPACIQSCVSGSPPHMRGKVYMSSFQASRMRITPAYAGKRWPQSIQEKRNLDHPRICGEKTKKIP